MGKLDLEIGMLYLELNLNVLLYGIMIMQTLEYYRRAHSDPKWIRRLVGFLFFGDTVNTVFDVALAYVRFVSTFGDLAAIPRITWYGNSLPTILSVMTIIASQIFFAYRVKRLSNKRWLFWLIVVLAILQCIGGISVTVTAAIIGRIDQLYKLKALYTAFVGVTILTDASITFALIWHLHQGRTGFQTTDDAISRIIRLTIQTGLITTIWATAGLITYLCVRGNLYLFFMYPLSKIYTNSVMSSLNARFRWGSLESSSASPNETGASIKFKNRSSSYVHPTAQRSMSMDGGMSVTTVTQSRSEDLELSIRMSQVEAPETVGHFDVPSSFSPFRPDERIVHGE